MAGIFHTVWYGCLIYFYFINGIFREYLTLHGIEHLELFLELLLFSNHVENAVSHKYIMQDDRSVFRAILEVAGYSSLIPRQKSTQQFLWNSINSSCNFKYQTF